MVLLELCVHLVPRRAGTHGYEVLLGEEDDLIERAQIKQHAGLSDTTESGVGTVAATADRKGRLQDGHQLQGEGQLEVTLDANEAGCGEPAR